MPGRYSSPSTGPAKGGGSREGIAIMRTRSVLAALAAPVLIAGAALAASAGPALAAQSNIKIPVGAQIPLGPAVCAPGDIVITVASGHDNMVTTPNGFHENATVQGLAQLVDPNTGTVLASGHGMAW